MDMEKKYDIFLSHSGHQKGFARDLYNSLSSHGYTVFFDETKDSLPPAQEFPPLIFSAANTCSLALVVISEDFVRSKWPMMELCVFADRYLSSSSDSRPSSNSHPSDPPPFPIFPLFFKLSPGDIKAKGKVEEWRKEWEGFEQKDKRICAAKCEEVVTKVLPYLNGVVRRSDSQQGETSYIEDVIDRVMSILIPRNRNRYRYGHNPNKHYVGIQRLCQVILDEFQKLEFEEDSNSSSSFDSNFMEPCILGMYGIPGSGKSTLCHFLLDSMFEEFRGKVIHLELPTELTHEDDPRLKEQYAKLLSMLIPHMKHTLIASMDLKQLYNLLSGASSVSYKMFVVLDNITFSNYEIYRIMAQAILSWGILGSGSKVMLVSHSSAILKNLLLESKVKYRIAQVPCWTDEEAMEVIRYLYPSVKDDVVAHLLRQSSFESPSFKYIPFILEQVGILLREKHCSNVQELEVLLEMVEEGKQITIEKLVEINFKLLSEDLRILFFDIALFIIPAGYNELSDAIPILCGMHGITKTFQLEWKITKLEKHCSLSITEEEEEKKRLRVHDIFIMYAKSIPGNSRFYVHRTFSDRARNSSSHPGLIQRETIDCLEARAINIATSTQSAYHKQVRFHVEVAIGSRTRALHARNNSQYYISSILVLSGDLSSLASLKIDNFKLKFSPSTRIVAHLSNLVRLDLRDNTIRNSVVKARKGQKSTSSRFFDLLSYHIQKNTETKALSPARYVNNFISSGRMTALRVLILENFAGILRLENIGMYCPELEVLEVLQSELISMDVVIRIGKAPKLKRFAAGSRSWLYYNFGRKSILETQKSRRQLVLELGECPELQDICVDGSFDQVKVQGLLPSKLRNLDVANVRCGPQFIPSNLVLSSAHQLSSLQRLQLICTKVKMLRFTQEHLGCFPSLEELHVELSVNLTHFSIDPGCVPNLATLKVNDCDNLAVLEGVEFLLMEQLKRLILASLSQLQLLLKCDQLSSVDAQLKHISLHSCPHVKIDSNVLEASKNLDYIFLKGGTIVQNHKQQSEQHAPSSSSSSSSPSSSLCLDPKISEAVHRLMFSEGKFMHLKDLQLFGVDHLREIEGIQHLCNLVWLGLIDLPNLTHVSGTWPTNIENIRLESCPMLLEIPSFLQQMLPNLSSLSCIRCGRLKAVEGSYFIEMKGLGYVHFIECESMEVSPMDLVAMAHEDKHWRKRRVFYPRMIHIQILLGVYGSKFVSTEVMQQRWLRDGELGSPLFEAAVEALLWEHMEKGNTEALNALKDYFSALTPIDEKVLQYLHRLFFSNYLWGYSDTNKFYRRKEMKLFQKWMLHKFQQLSLFT